MYVVFPMMGLTRSGGVRVVSMLANGLVARGHRARLLIARPAEPGFPLDQRVEIQQARARRSVLEELWWLARSIPREADAVVANYYLTAYPTALATGMRRAKGYYFVQGYEPAFFRPGSSRRAPSAQRVLARCSYRLPLRLITISTWLQSLLRSETGRDAVVIHDGVDAQAFTPPSDAPQREGAPTLLFVGTSDPGKGLQLLLRAVEILANQVPGLRLLVATQDRQIDATGPVPIEVVHPGDDRELVECYRRADVFVFASRQEGFGLPPLEAMACGTPVVTTDCGGNSDYAQDGANCLVVPVGDAKAMAMAIHRILVDASLALRLAEAGRITACRFTWDAMADRFERLLAGTGRSSEARS